MDFNFGAGFAVRNITDDEVVHYRKFGWVMLKSLISSAAASTLERSVLEDDPTGAQWKRATDPRQSYLWPFVSHPAMKRNAEKLMNRGRLGRDPAIRLRAAFGAINPPGTAGARWHQDTSEHGADCNDEMQFWLALGHITPEMGTMRFLSGSHSEGPLGTVYCKQSTGDLVELCPKLTDLYPPTPYLQYEPGDATVHHGFTVHGSCENRSNRSRVSLICAYTPADVKYWNGSPENGGKLRTLLDDTLNPKLD